MFVNCLAVVEAVRLTGKARKQTLEMRKRVREKEAKGKREKAMQIRRDLQIVRRHNEAMVERMRTPTPPPKKTP